MSRLLVDYRRWPATDEGRVCAFLERLGGLVLLSPAEAAGLRFALPGPLGKATGCTAWLPAVAASARLRPHMGKPPGRSRKVMTP